MVVHGLRRVGADRRSSAGADTGADNLLAGRSPERSEGVQRASVLSRGTAARTGDFRNTDATAAFTSARAFVVYDLGAVHVITALWLQGDGDDTYEVSMSTDGEQFTPLWRAMPTPNTGMRSRFASGLSRSARYLRVSANGGTGLSA